jgi:hypothetical protein
MRCIYCLQDKDELSFQKREHVIPQCFGCFSPDNLILRKLVCDECNQYFGDKIELFWGRDSLESILRLKHGISPKEPLKKRRRVKSKILNGDIRGAIVKEGIDDKGNIGVEKLVQVGFYNEKKNEYDWFEAGTIPNSTELFELGYEYKEHEIWLIGDNEEVKMLERELQEKGIPLKGESKFIKGVEPGELVVIEAEATLDRVIMRGICKIAFNYLAFIAGRHFVISDNFNLIRNFIRYDDGNSEKYLFVNQPPILHDDQKYEKYKVKITEGHLIILGWKNDRKLFSMVSLFNTHTYSINLCENYDGLWIPIKSGHHFEIRTREVSKLLAISRRLIP